MDNPLSAPANWDDPPDNEHARRALKFIRACPHTKGHLAVEGKTLGDSWLPWQEKLTRHVFGTVDENGLRKYRTVYVEMPKKAGKSTYLAAVKLYLLGPDGVAGGELYSAAYKKEQAKVVWKIAREMVKRSPALQKRIEVVDYKNELRCPELGSVYKPITRKAMGQHGFNPSAVAFDELHVQPDRELWDTIDDSMGARREPLLFAITNSGSDRESICYEQREYAMDNNDESTGWSDESFLGVVYGAHPEKDDPWEEDTWKKANPGLGTTVPVEWMRNKAEQAKRIPSKQNAFKRWQLGIWTEQDTRWIDPEVWDACEREYSEADLLGRPCFGGLDLGSNDDLTAWVLAFPEAGDRETIKLLCRAWCPEDRLTDTENRYRDQYQAWAQEGWLKTVRGGSMDYGPVIHQIQKDAEQFGLVDMAVDHQWQGRHLMTQLENEYGLAVAGMKTTYNDMTAPCDEFDRRIYLDEDEGGPKITHRGNPVLTWAVHNVELKQPDPDRKRPVPPTERHERKIDPMVAALYALDRAMRHTEQQQTTSWLL